MASSDSSLCLCASVRALSVSDGISHGATEAQRRRSGRKGASVVIRLVHGGPRLPRRDPVRPREPGRAHATRSTRAGEHAFSDRAVTRLREVGLVGSCAARIVRRDSTSRVDPEPASSRDAAADPWSSWDRSDLDARRWVSFAREFTAHARYAGVDLLASTAR